MIYKVIIIYRAIGFYNAISFYKVVGFYKVINYHKFSLSYKVKARTKWHNIIFMIINEAMLHECYTKKSFVTET